jgi:choloylglycine hydrolase
MCTGIFIKTENGECYQARTMEFAYKLKFSPTITPTIIGCAIDKTDFLDGINIHGLCVMSFYFKCSVSYNKDDLKNKINLASFKLTGYFLNNAKSVNDVKRISKNININSENYGEPFNSIIPLHWFISDKSGKTIIVEAKKGALYCYDNSKYKVCSNNPSFEEQTKSLKTLISKNNFSKDFVCNPKDDKDCDLGKGLIGMPGDYSSFGRFARAYLLGKSLILSPKITKISNIDNIFHFMNNFDIVYGAVKDCKKEGNLVDFTQYTVIYDLTNLKVHYKTFANPEIRMLHFHNIPSKLSKKSKKTNKKRNYKKIRKTKRRI